MRSVYILFADLSHLSSNCTDAHITPTSSKFDVSLQFFSCAGQQDSCGQCDKKPSLNCTLCDLTERKTHFHLEINTNRSDCDKIAVNSCSCEVSEDGIFRECYTLNCDCGGGKLDEDCILCLCCHTSPAEDTPVFNHWVLALLLYMFCVATVAGNFLVILAVAQVIIMT